MQFTLKGYSILLKIERISVKYELLYYDKMILFFVKSTITFYVINFLRFSIPYMVSIFPFVVLNLQYLKQNFLF